MIDTSPRSFPTGVKRSAVVVVLLAATWATAARQPARRASNVLVVSMDGLRWQELFGGLSGDYLTPKNGGVQDAATIERRFGHAGGAARAPDAVLLDGRREGGTGLRRSRGRQRGTRDQRAPLLVPGL